MTVPAGLLIVSALSFGAFALLGRAACSSPSLWRIDRSARAFVGKGTIAAACFTFSGRAFGLAACAIAAVIAVAATHGSLVVAIAICAAQVCSQAAAEVAKRRFRRARPDHWIFHEELGFSYPSGHAVTAALFFGSWLLYVVFIGGSHAATAVTAGVLLLWIVGIDWSRLALGAHYPVDVIGGTLFGTGWLALLWALLLEFGRVHPK